MKEKIERVVNSCNTLSQLWSASNYVILSSAYSDDYIYGLILVRSKLEKMTGAHLRNYIDYTAYAQHLMATGLFKDSYIFANFAELELEKLEDFYTKTGLCQER